MVGAFRLIQSDVKCRSVTAFKELTSKGLEERHENSPADRTVELIFFCFPVQAAFWSINALSASGWSETQNRLPNTFW